MKKEDLEKMTLKQLELLEDKISDAKKVATKRALEDARAEVRKIAGRFGVPINKIAKGHHNKPAGKAIYRHPTNKNLTWSGRGPKPKWLREVEAKEAAE